MKFLSKIIAFTVIVAVAGACGRDARNGTDSQSEKGTQTGLGAEPKTNSESAIGNSSTTQDSTSANSYPTSPTQFVVTAADGGLLEVRLGELANRNGSSAEVKEFGRTMVSDHQKTNSELLNLANELNISVPDALSEKSQRKYDDLAKKNGSDFDTAYATMMVSGHLETIQLFRTASNISVEPTLREWAGAKLPHLEHHLQMAQRLTDGAATTLIGQ